MRVKDWKRFQHFKDRKPPWIKLYGDLLDDPDWHELDPFDAKILVMIWLIAKDDDKKTGELPGLKKLAFRLRIEVKVLVEVLQRLTHWIEGVDAELISSGYQTDAPETETETETETEKKIHSSSADEVSEKEEAEEEFYKTKKGKKLKGQALTDFNIFWKTFKHPYGKADAADAWLKVYSPEILQEILAGAKRTADARPGIKAKGGTPKMAQGWLNSRRWEDGDAGGVSGACDCGSCDYRRRGDCDQTRTVCKSYTPVN